MTCCTKTIDALEDVFDTLADAITEHPDKLLYLLKHYREYKKADRKKVIKLAVKYLEQAANAVVLPPPPSPVTVIENSLDKSPIG